jgi:hypothetical protein
MNRNSAKPSHSGRLVRAGVVAGTLILVAITPARAQEPVLGGAARLAAWERRMEMAEASPFKELEWQWLGPKYVGGRIESMDAPLGRPGTIYVGVGAGSRWVISPFPPRSPTPSGWGRGRPTFQGHRTPEPGFSNPRTEA